MCNNFSIRASCHTPSINFPIIIVPSAVTLQISLLPSDTVAPVLFDLKLVSQSRSKVKCFDALLSISQTSLIDFHYATLRAEYSRAFDTL